MKKQYLLLFTIGPVKSFINDSRKMQDLFAGSKILSHLSTLAINKAIKLFNQGNQIIVTPEIDTPYKPNRFVAKITADNLNLSDIGESIEKEVKDAFLQITKKLFKGTFQKPDGFDEQLENFLEIHWLYVPIVNDGYNVAYRKLFTELAAQKNLTHFVQQEEVGRKCNVDGKRNVKVYREDVNEKIDFFKGGVIYKKLYQKEKDVRIIENNDEQNLKIWHLQDGEGLSAVSLTKRIFNPNNTNISTPHLFPSTVAVALQDMFYKIENDDKKYGHIKNDFQHFKNQVQGTKNGISKYLKHSNDQLFYKENIKGIFKKYEKDSTQCDNEHHKWSENLDLPFTKYYALIRFDGDNMGDWLLGDRIKNNKLEDFHRAFTKNVHEFGKIIENYLNDKGRGKLVYAGGEDFMAFVNIHHLFDVLQEIKDIYNVKISEALKDFKRDENVAMTISIGVAVAHYKQPLSMVLEKAKEMENKAKESGRNRFAIGVMKHSGGRLDCVMEWDFNNGIKSLTLLDRIYKNIENNSFSSSGLRNIYHSFENFGFGMDDDLLESKIKLYTPRANMCNDKQKIESMIKDITDLSKTPKEDFANSLLMIDFLIRKTK